MDYLYGGVMWPILRFWRSLSVVEIDYETAQTVADLIVGRLESRGIIELTKARSLSATYKLVDSDEQ